MLVGTNTIERAYTIAFEVDMAGTIENLPTTRKRSRADHTTGYRFEMNYAEKYGVPDRRQANSSFASVGQADLLMKGEKMVRLRASLVLALASFGSHANASDGCVVQLNKLVDDWNSIAVPGSSTAGPARPQAPDHEHSVSEVWYMRSQIRLALRLCNENKEHEALLRMDVVRAWLKLPEVQHPVDHRYMFDEEGKPPNLK